MLIMLSAPERCLKAVQWRLSLWMLRISKIQKKNDRKKKEWDLIERVETFFGQSRFIYNNLSLILPCLCGTAFLYAPLWLLINSELVAPEYFTSLLLVSLIYGFVVSLKLQQQHFLVRCSTNDVFFPSLNTHHFKRFSPQHFNLCGWGLGDLSQRAVVLRSSRASWASSCLLCSGRSTKDLVLTHGDDTD